MSYSEIQAALPALPADESASLHEALFAIEEGVSVEEWRAMNAALSEEISSPSPVIAAEGVFSRMEAKYRPNAA